MANEKRLIDANAFLDEIKKRHDDIMQDPIVDKATKWRESVCFGGVVNVLVKMPTVDAVEVARCGKCKSRPKGEYGMCHKLCRQTHEDDFCSYGERKDNDG